MHKDVTSYVIRCASRNKNDNLILESKQLKKGELL